MIEIILVCFFTTAGLTLDPKVLQLSATTVGTGWKT